MRKKHLIALPIAGMFALSGCFADSPPAPTVTPPPVTQTVTSPPTTVTETVTPPTVTDTVTQPAPPVNPQNCVDKGINTVGWNTARDTPSINELRLEHTDPNTKPMVDAPLVDIRAWYGKCFDTVEFVFDTNLNDWKHNDRPWFDVQYVPVVTQDGSGRTITLDGTADLQVVIFAPADSWHYGDPDRPVKPVEANDYRRVMDYNFGAVNEVQGAGDFEGIVTFGIGIDEKRPFAAEFSDNSDGTTSVVVRVFNR